MAQFISLRTCSIEAGPSLRARKCAFFRMTGGGIPCLVFGIGYACIVEYRERFSAHSSRGFQSQDQTHLGITFANKRHLVDLEFLVLSLPPTLDPLAPQTGRTSY